MNYILMPSLQQRALIKTTITVWNQDDIMALTAEISSTNFSKRQKVIEDKIIEKMQVLPLPELLKIRLANFVKPIFFQVLHWWDSHKDLYVGKTFLKESLNKICWTPQGTIDRKKTAEAIIRDENLGIKERYKMACFYCLRNDILMLWNQIPESRRKFFCSETLTFTQHPLAVLWSYEVKGEMTTMENITRERYRSTPYQYALEQSVLDGNQVATEYILQKLSSEEREESLIRSTEVFCTGTIHSRFPYNVDVLFFLLSQMKEEQQIKVLNRFPYEVLSCCLYWPWQGLFMKMAKHVWAFLHTDVFYDLLENIIEKVKCGFKDYDYQCLFREFWQQSLVTHKRHIIHMCTNKTHFFLSDLLQLKDIGNMKLILEDLPSPDREKVIFSTCERTVCDGKMSLLEFFVKECLSTEDLTIKFRDEFKKHIIRNRSKKTLEKQKDMWSKAFQLLDGLTQKCDDKRCVEDGDNGPAKRFCSLT